MKPQRTIASGVCVYWDTHTNPKQSGWVAAAQELEEEDGSPHESSVEPFSCIPVEGRRGAFRKAVRQAAHYYHVRQADVAVVEQDSQEYWELK